MLTGSPCLQIADLGASRRFDQEEVVRRMADHEGNSMLSMTMVGTPVCNCDALACRSSYFDRGNSGLALRAFFHAPQLNATLPKMSDSTNYSLG